MDFNTVNIAISGDAAARMGERGVKEEDVRELICYAEETGKKLYIEGEQHYLARKRMGKFSAYAEYTVSDGGIELLDVYSHMVTLQEDK